MEIAGNQSKIISLYTQLNDVASDMDWGTEDDFLKGMSDPENRKWLHQTLSERGMFSEDYDLDTFNNKLGFGVINLGDDTETGTGPVDVDKMANKPKNQWEQTQVQPMQYGNRPVQEEQTEEPLPRVPQVPMSNVQPRQEMPMYQGYQPAQPAGVYGQQETVEQPANAAAPLTEEASAERGAELRRRINEKAKQAENGAMMESVYGIQEYTQNLQRGLEQQKQDIAQGRYINLEQDRQNKLQQMARRQQVEAASAYVWDYMIRPKLGDSKFGAVNKDSMVTASKLPLTEAEADITYNRMMSSISDDVVEAYARTAYGVTGKMDFDTRIGLRHEVEGMMAGQMLDMMIKNNAPKSAMQFFETKVRTSLLPDQLAGIATNIWGPEGRKLYLAAQQSYMSSQENQYDSTWAGSLMTHAAAGTAFAFNMMMLGKVMNGGLAAEFGGYTPVASSALFAPGQAGAQWAIRDAIINNPYTNAMLRGTANLAAQYIGFGRLEAINTGLAIMGDPNLVNRYGRLSSVSGWLGELGCDAKKLVDAYAEGGNTGIKFGLLSMGTTGLTNMVRGNVYDKAIKAGMGRYEAANAAARSKAGMATKVLGLGGELGFFTFQDVDAWNEMHANNPKEQIGITDVEKWSSFAIKQIGFLGALKAVNLGHASANQYKHLAEMGVRHARLGQTMLDTNHLTLDKNDLNSIAYAGLGRHSEFSPELLNALMRRAEGTDMTVYEQMMREDKIPTMTKYKLKVAMEHQITNMGYTCDNNGRIVFSVNPTDFVTSASVYHNAGPDGGFNVYAFGMRGETVAIKTFKTRENAEAYAELVRNMSKLNSLRAMETQIGDTRTTVVDVLHQWADKNGIGRMDAEDLYNEYLNDRENASPQAKAMAEEVKGEMWDLVNQNRMQAIAKTRQQIKETTGIDVSDLLSRDPSTLSNDDLAAVDTYNKMLWEIKKTATTDPDILAVEKAIDPETGMVREGVTKDGREVTVKGSGNAVVVTEKANPAEGKPAGKPEMVSSAEVTITKETPAEDVIKQINDAKAEEQVVPVEDRQVEPVNEAPVEPVAERPEETVEEKPAVAEEREEQPRKVTVFDSNNGAEYEGEDVGAGQLVGSRRVRLSDGRFMDVPSEDLTYEEVQEGSKEVQEGLGGSNVAPEAPMEANTEVASAEDVSNRGTSGGVEVEDSGVKVDANTGMPTMENEPRVTASYLMNDPELDSIGEQLINQRRDAANKAYEAAMKKQPRIGTDGNLLRIKQEKAAIKAEQEQLKAVADYWNEVGMQADAIKNQKAQQAKDQKMMEDRDGQTQGAKLTRRIDKVMTEMGEPTTPREAVLMDFLKPGGLGVSKEDLASELGAAGENVTAEGMRNMLARGDRKNLGNTIQSIAEGIASEHGWDMQQVRDEIIDVLMTYGGDKSRAVAELERIADVVSGRRGQYTAEEAERMRQQAVADGEDLNEKPAVAGLPEELRPSTVDAPFDIESEDDPMARMEEEAERKTTEKRVSIIAADAEVDLNKGDVLGKIYTINGHLSIAQGQAVNDAKSILANGRDSEGAGMNPIAFIDPKTVIGKDRYGRDVTEAEIYKRQQRALHPLYEAYIKMMDEQIAKTKDPETVKRLKANRENVRKRMEQVDRTIDPNYDAYNEYWNKDRVFDFEDEEPAQPAAEEPKTNGKITEETFKESLKNLRSRAEYKNLIDRIASDGTLSVDEKSKYINETYKRWHEVKEAMMQRVSKFSGVEMDLLNRLARATGIDIVEGGNFSSKLENGFYDRKNNEIHINPNGNKISNLTGILGHETCHGIEGAEGYEELAGHLLDIAYEGDAAKIDEAINDIIKRYNKHLGEGAIDYAGAKKEVVANVLKTHIFNGEEGRKMLDQAIERMQNKSMSGRFAAKLRDMYDFAVTAYNEGWGKAITKKELMDARDHYADVFRKYREQNDKRAMIDGTIIDNRGDEVAWVDDDKNIQLNLETYGYDPVKGSYYQWKDNLGQLHDGTRKRIEQYFDDKISSGLMTPEDKERMLANMDWWHSYMRKVNDLVDENGKLKYEEFREWNKKQPQYRLIGKDIEEKVLSTIVKNGEYPVNLELTTDCIKREGFTQLLNQIVRMKPGSLKNLNPREITVIQDMMKSYGLQTACPLCFVEGKRLMIRNRAQSIVDDYNVALAEALSGSEMLNGWKPKFKEVTEVVDGKKKTRKYVANLDEMEELLGAFGFAGDDAVSEESWDMVKERAELGERREFVKRVNSTFDLLTGRKGGLLKDDKRSLEIAAKKASDRMLEMELSWKQAHPDEEWVMTDEEINEINGILYEGKKVVHDKMVNAIMQHTDLRKVLHLEDLIGSTGLDNIRARGDEAHRRLYSMILSSFGAGTPKVVQRAEAYAGEIMDRSMDNAVDKAMKEGGWRLFSFSDFDITKTFDIMQIFWDAEARGAKLQSYTKEVPYILFFGRNTNAKINMSTLVEVRPSGDMLTAYRNAPETSKNPNVPTKKQIKKQIEEYAGLELDNDGNIIGMTFSNSHSVSPLFAQEIFRDEAYNANCGATTVGVSVNHTLWAMKTPWIRQVIPFHLSGMPIAARERTDVGWYRDATSDQNTCVKNDKGEWVSIHGKWAKSNVKTEDFNFYAGEENPEWDMRTRCEEYIAWCNKNGFRPKFEWAVNADKYVEWCKENGYEPNAQIEEEMRAHTTNGVYDNYYKVICDFNPYQPVFDSNGKYVGDVKAPHKPIKGEFVSDQEMLDMIFEDDNSMLANRERNIDHANRMMPKMANDAISYLEGKKSAEEIMSTDPDAFRNKEDADLYVSRRRNQQFDIENAEQAGPVRSRNFKNWFGDWELDPEGSSKVVDEDGKPMVVYHYTNGKEIVNKKTGQKYDDLDWQEKDYWNNEATDEEWNDAWEERDFDAFDTSKARRSVEVPGIFFSPSPTETRDFGKRRIAAYINLKNPIYDPKPKEMGFDMGTTNDMGEQFMKHLRKLGYDGIINTEDGEVYEVVAFDPEQVKSVDNRGTFDPRDKRFQYDMESEEGEETKNQQPNTAAGDDVEKTKNVGYTEADVDRRVAELNNQQKEQTSSMTNIGGKPRQMPDDTFSPDKTGAAGVSAGAKVSKKLRKSEDLEMKMASFIAEIEKDNSLESKDFNMRLFDAIGLTEETNPSKYVHVINNGVDTYSLRLSDHRGNARNIIVKSLKTDRGFSIVIDVDGTVINTPVSEINPKFKRSSKANVDEFVYSQPDAERLRKIAKSIFGLFSTGEYVDLAKADEHNVSPRDTAYEKAVKEGDRATALRMLEEEANKKLNKSLLLPDDSDEKGFQYHRGPAPKKTFKRYAVFNVTPDGFKAAYAGNKTATPVGVWIDAQNLQSYLSDMVQFADGSFASYIVGDTGAAMNTKFSPERAEELGLKGGQRFLLERGGKHSSDVPNFSQMNLKQDENGNKVSSAKDGALPHNKLIFEIEYGIDENGDLTDYVRENGRIDAAGKNQGLAKIAPNQYYDFKTNPNAVGNWGIGGTFRITRIVPHEEIVSKTEEYKKNAIDEANRAFEAGEISKSDRDKRIKNAESIQVQKWVGGYHPEEFGITEESMKELYDEGQNKKVMDITYDDEGNLIPLSKRFDTKVKDLRYDIDADEEPVEPIEDAGEPVDYKADAEEQAWRKYRELVDGIEKEAANFQRELDYIKNGGTDKGLLTRVRYFVRIRLNLATGTGLGPAGINNLMDQLDKVQDSRDIEPILQQIQYTLNRAELKTEMDEMLKMLNTKTQSQTSRGLVKGIGVDSQTNQVLADIRGSFKSMITTDIDEKIREVNRQIRDLKKEYGINHVEDGDAEFQTKYRELRDQYTSLVEQRAEAGKLQAQESEEQLTERHMQILDEMNDYREKGLPIPTTLIEERIALPIRQQLAQLTAMTHSMDEASKELQEERDAMVGMTGEDRKRQKELINDKQKALINWQRRCVLMSKQISEDLRDLISEGRSKRAELVKKQIEEENRLVYEALNAVDDERVNPRNQPAGATSHVDRPWNTMDKMAASIQDSMKDIKENQRKKLQDFNAPVYSFNFLLKYLDRNHGQGDGPLYRMLMKDEGGAVEANDKYADGKVEFDNRVNDKVKEIFGYGLKRLMEESRERTYKTIQVAQLMEDGSYWEKAVEVTKGQALYIWLMSRQQAGMEKLEGDGWTSDKIHELEELMGNKYMKLGTWITEEFLPQLRAEKYNPTYEKLYGTSMHMAAHYFPIKIWDKVIHEKGEIGESIEGMPSAATGNLVMRKNNKLPIDTEVDALEMLMKYGQQMERWNAMSELTQKLNVLKHCNAFRNRIIANEGEQMWQMWLDACDVVTNNYQSTESNALGKFMGKLQNSFMKNAIGFRHYTAMKQMLSYPAFAAYSGNLEFQAELIANIGRTFTAGKEDSMWESNYKWALRTLPSFRQRVDEGNIGLEGLNDDGIGGTLERKWSEWGMMANKAVDARTVAAGARAVYNYEYKQGKKRGLSDEEAKRLAVINAEICFNESQQSSRPEFSSPMQKNRDLLSRSTVAFQNSNIGYRRGVLEGLNDILRANHVYKVALQERRLNEGESEAQFEERIKKERMNQYGRGVRKVLTFGAWLPALWYIGSNPSTLWANNDDDKEKDKFWTNMLANIAMGTFTNGTTFGPLTQSLYNSVYKLLTDDSQSSTADYNPLQAFSLLSEILNDAFKVYREDQKTEGGIGVSGYAEGMANWAMRFVGINPETWTNIYLGIADAVKRGHPELQDAMFILNVPGSQRKAIVERMARNEEPAEYMRQIEEAGKLYEEGDSRYGKIQQGTRLLTDNKRHELLQSYLDAKNPDFATEMETIKAFEKAVKDRVAEISQQLVVDGEIRHSELIHLEALTDVAESGEFDIDLDAYKRLSYNLVRKDDGSLDVYEEMTSSGKKFHRQTLMQKYKRLRKQCDEAAANIAEDPEKLNDLVKELMDVQTKIMIALGK